MCKPCLSLFCISWFIAIVFTTTETDTECRVDDKENVDTAAENKSSQNIEEPPKKKRGWPKGVPRGSPYARKPVPKGRPPKVSYNIENFLVLF